MIHPVSTDIRPNGVDFQGRICWQKLVQSLLNDDERDNKIVSLIERLYLSRKILVVTSQLHHRLTLSCLLPFGVTVRTIDDENKTSDTEFGDLSEDKSLDGSHKFTFSDITSPLYDSVIIVSPLQYEDLEKFLGGRHPLTEIYYLIDNHPVCRFHLRRLMRKNEESYEDYFVNETGKILS